MQGRPLQACTSCVFQSLATTGQEEVVHTGTAPRHAWPRQRRTKAGISCRRPRRNLLAWPGDAHKRSRIVLRLDAAEQIRLGVIVSEDADFVNPVTVVDSSREAASFLRGPPFTLAARRCRSTTCVRCRRLARWSRCGRPVTASAAISRPRAAEGQAVEEGNVGV